MKLTTRLGDATWNNQASDVCFVGREFLVSAGNPFTVFDITTGTAVATWWKYNEDINCLCHGTEGTFFVGGSFGNVYTLAWTKGQTIELLEEREVLSYLDWVAFSGRHNVVAVVCDTDLRLLPREGMSGIIDLTFADTIRSIEWSDKLDAFLIASGRTVFVLTAGGHRSVIVQRESRVLSAKHHERTDSLTLLVGTSDNDANVTRLDRATLASKWTIPFKLDHHEFRTTTQREVDIGSLQITDGGDSIVGGVNWLRRYNPDGIEIGSVLLLSELVRAVSASPDGDLVAMASPFSPLRVWDREFQPLLPRDCHYSSVEHLTFADGDSLIVSGDGFSPDVICWHIEKNQREWTRSYDGIWCDGLFCTGSAGDELIVACSQPETTTIIRANVHSGEVLESKNVELDYRAHVALLASGELSLAPSWAFGPEGTAAIGEFPSLKVLSKVTDGDYPLTVVAASKAYIAAADRHHIWLWDREDVSRRRDFEIPGERASGRCPVHSILFTDDKSFFAVTISGAYQFSSPRYQPKVLAEFKGQATSVSQPHRKMIIVGFEDGRAELRSVPDFRLLDSWIAHEGMFVSVVTIASTKSLVATGAGNGTIAVWDFS